MLVESIKNFFKVWFWLIKNWIKYPIKFSILKYRCNKVLRLSHAGYLSREQAKSVIKRLQYVFRKDFNNNFEIFEGYLKK